MKLLIGLICMFNILTVEGSSSDTEPQQTQALIVILTGPPGSGKGTHAVPLSEELSIPHISTGDILREAIRNKTPIGIKAKHYIDEGELVPDELVIEMLFSRVSRPDCKKGYILDGFPRTIAQAKALDQRIHSKIVLNFQLEDATIIERITGRIACKKCGRPYHKAFAPPKIEMICDCCNGPLYQRDDDKEEIIRKRLQVYRAETEPLIQYYKSQPGVLYNIDSSLEKSKVFQQCIQQVPKLVGAK